MRNKHGKGKIHPSPSQQLPPGDCLSALSLLPAAILALTAALCLEDKEVLAYFVTRCVIGSGSAYEAAAGAEQSRRKGKGVAAAGGGSPLAAPHPPRFDCGCFGCYTSFWTRWGSSPHGELIHLAIEAFEKHLAEGEGAAGGRRNKERRGGAGGGGEKKEKRDNKAGRKGKKKKAVVKVAAGVVGLAEQDAAGVAAVTEGGSSSSSSMNAVDPVAVQSELAVAVAGAAVELEVADRPVLEVAEWSDDSDGGRCSAGGEKKKAWLDVMGFLNSRLWSLWSPSA